MEELKEHGRHVEDAPEALTQRDPAASDEAKKSEKAEREPEGWEKEEDQ